MTQETPAGLAGTVPRRYKWIVPAATALVILSIVARVQEQIYFSLGLLLPLSRLALAFGLLALIVDTPRDRLRALARQRSVRLFGFLMLWAVVSIPGSTWRGGSVSFVTSVLPPLVTMMAVVAAFLDDRRVVTTVIVALLLGSCAAAVMGLALPAVGNRFGVGGSYDANDTAALFTISLPYAALLLFRRGGFGRLLGAVTIPLVLAAFLRTGSRGGLIGLVALMAWGFVVTRGRARALAVVSAVVLAVVLAAAMPADYKARFLDVTSGKDYNLESNVGRVAIWKRGLRYATDNPLTGIGVGMFMAKDLQSGGSGVGRSHQAMTAHNSYVLALAELGFPGGLAFLGLIGVSIVGCVQRYRSLSVLDARGGSLLSEHRALVAAASASLMGTATTGFFLSNTYSPLMLFPLAMAAGVLTAAPSAASARERTAVPNASPPREALRTLRGVRGGLARVS